MARNTLKEKAARCSQMACKVRWCSNRRYGVSSYCSKHKTAQRNHGHPEARSILPREYRSYRKRVGSFIDKHKAAHIGLQETIMELNNWLSRASKSLLPNDELIARLSDYGITGEQVLKETAAIYAYSRDMETILPDDQRLTFALGRAVLRLGSSLQSNRYDHESRTHVRTYKRYQGKQCREIGELLRKRYGVLYLNICLGIHKETHNNLEREQQINKPFTTGELNNERR